MKERHIYDIDARQIKAASKEVACLVLDKMEALDINITELNNRYLRAGHNFNSSCGMAVTR